MSCNCPIDDYASEKLFYQCSTTDKCLPKNIECDIKRECNGLSIDDDYENDDDYDNNNECPPFSSLSNRLCTVNNTCLGDNQYCRVYFHKRCFCQPGYRMNETTGICEDIDECRERVICDHYCINTPGLYRCSCHENYILQPDKHTCTFRTNLLSSGKITANSFFIILSELFSSLCICSI